MSFKDTEIGKIPSNWEVNMIQDIGEIISGGTPKTKELSYWDGDISWITPKDLSNFNERYIEVGERSITEEGLNNSSAKLLPKGTVLFSSRAPIGYVAIANKEVCTNQGFKNIVCNKNISHNEFIYYMMKHKKNDIESIAGGSTFKEVSGKVIKEFKLPIPPIEEQKAIAKILSDLDNKIEVNNKINQILEEMAQSIFKHWFVDFEFPNEEGKPYKSSGGEMVESELGMIPKGWEVKGLNSVAEFQNGYAFYKEGYSDKGIKVIDLANVNSLGNFVETDRDKYISYELYNKEKLIKYRLNKDDLIIIMTDRTQDMNILGKTAKIPYSNKFILNQRVGRLRAINGINVNFLLSYMNSPVILEELKSISLGSVQKYFNTTHIKDLKFIIPNEKVMDLYSKYIDCIYNQMFILNEEIIRLSNLRDTLLPKLMSGEIRVPVK